jgi:hypothetical protein
MLLKKHNFYCSNYILVRDPSELAVSSTAPVPKHEFSVDKKLKLDYAKLFLCYWPIYCTILIELDDLEVQTELFFSSLFYFCY